MKWFTDGKTTILCKMKKATIFENAITTAATIFPEKIDIQICKEVEMMETFNCTIVIAFIMKKKLESLKNNC